MNTFANVFPRTRPMGLHIVLWIAQGLLAAMFLFSGGMKLLHPAMAKGMPVALVMFIGTSEVLGALGLLLPGLLRNRPWLTPLAALGILTIMVLATGLHLIKGERSHAVVCVILGAIALFVAWGRYKAAPLRDR